MALVVFEPSPAHVGARIDWSDWYLTDEEDMGQNPDQADSIDIFKASLRILAEERSWQEVRIGFDEFFAWVEGEPLVRVSPDVFLMDNPPPKPFPKVWATWKPGINPPRFALEIVSEDWKKDYDDNPPKYAQLGTSELVIFDPLAARDQTSNPRRAALQLFRREADGAFVRVPVSGRSAWSEELDIWLVVLSDGPEVSVRLARDPKGCDLVPTNTEARQEAERQRAEAERQRAEERQARQEAEQKLAGERTPLIRRLDQRFGPLTPEQRQHLETQDTEALLKALLTATTLDNLLS
jgi:hypothetical protein